MELYNTLTGEKMPSLHDEVEAAMAKSLPRLERWAKNEQWSPAKLRREIATERRNLTRSIDYARHQAALYKSHLYAAVES